MKATTDKTPDRRFLTIKQVAEELNVGEPLVRVMLKTGQLRGFQVEGRGAWRVGTTDVEDFIADAYETTLERIAAGRTEGHRPWERRMKQRYAARAGLVLRSRQNGSCPLEGVRP